jgi:RNA-directed DNA polymerase
VLFGNSKEALHTIREHIKEYLATLRLKLHERKSRICRVDDGISFLGYRIYPTHRLLKKDNALRMRRRLKALSLQYRQGDITFERVHQSIQSWIGHASHADTYRLREALLGGVAFPEGVKPKGSAGRFLEQQSG